MTVVALFDHDLTDILAILPAFDDIWAEDRFRPAGQPERIPLRRQPGSRPRDELHQLASVATRHYANQPVSDAIFQILAHVQGRPARVFLERLLPGDRIERPVEHSIYAAATERFLLPIVTNPDVWIVVDDVTYHLQAGTVYALDQHLAHAYGNDSTEPCVHLIVDVHPESAEVLAS